ncbi:MAG: hypothetical protein ACK4M7_10840, partial [Burkholderiales bacterium]
MKQLNDYLVRKALAKLKEPAATDLSATEIFAENYQQVKEIVLSKKFNKLPKETQELVIDKLANYFTSIGQNTANYINSQELMIQNLYHEYDPTSETNLASGKKIIQLSNEALDLFKTKLGERWNKLCRNHATEFTEKVCFTQMEWNNYVAKEKPSKGVSLFLTTIENEVKKAFEKQYSHYVTDVVQKHNETVDEKDAVPFLKVASDLPAYVI